MLPTAAASPYKRKERPVTRYLRARLILAPLAILLGPVSGGEPPPPKAADIGRLVQQLGSDSFEEREAASKALERIGEAALPALRRATGSDDAEIRRRARDAMKATYVRVEAEDARALQGTWVLQSAEWLGERTDQDALLSDVDLRRDYLRRKAEERELPQDRKEQRTTLIIKGNAFDFEMMREPFGGGGPVRCSWGGTFALDVSRARKVLVRRYGGNPPETGYALYSVQGDTMRWCLRDPGGPDDLPTKFAADRDPDVFLLTFKREQT
jgi:hypothetical protein